ncbi:MAG: hypothetical protein J5845_04385 [Lachnospiraceae bacterium]|nr:hypothetical protein [Lachnospiraceae bacterium]
MSGEKNKTKGKLRMKRRTFVILILSVCVIALGAEALLLIHSFSKKKEKRKPAETQHENYSKEEPKTNTPDVKPTGDPENRMVYKKTREEVYETAGEWKEGEDPLNDMYSDTRYEYDEQGRLSKKEIHFYDKNDPREYYYTYTYVPSGTVTDILTVYPESNPWGYEGEQHSKSYEILYDHVMSDARGNEVQEVCDENGYWKELINKENGEKAAFSYDEQGRITKVIITVYQGKSDDLSMITECEYTYQDDGTVVYTRCSRDFEFSDGSVRSYNVKTYNGDRILRHEYYRDDSEDYWLYTYEYTTGGVWEYYFSRSANAELNNDSKSFTLATGESFPPEVASWNASTYDSYRFETDAYNNVTALLGSNGVEEFEIAAVKYDEKGRAVRFSEQTRWEEDEIRYVYDFCDNLIEIDQTVKSDQSYQSITYITYEEVRETVNGIREPSGNVTCGNGMK